MDNKKGLNILIVEDEPDTAKTLGMLLRKKVSAQPETALNCTAAREKIKNFNFDLITLDYQLPDGDGLSLLQEIVSMDDPPPVVMVTGHGDERTAVEAFKHGASGYVVKDRRISIMLVEEVKAALLKRDLLRAELALAEKNNMLRHVFDSAAEPILIGGPDGRLEYVNPALAASFGYENPDELIGMVISDRYADPAERDKLISMLMEKGSISNYKIKLRRRDGSILDGEVNAVLYRDEDGNILHTMASTSLQQREGNEGEDSLSEEMYKQTFNDMTGCAVILKTVDDGETFVFVDFNKAAEKVEDIKREDLIGRMVTEVFPGIEKGGLYDIIRNVWRTGEPKRFPLGFYSDDRISGWRSGNVFRLPDHKVIVIYDESAELMKTARELEKSNEMLLHIYEAAPEGIMVTNSDQVIEFVNSKALEILKISSPDDLIGSSLTNCYVDSGDSERVLDIMLDKGFVSDYEAELKHEDGTGFWGSLNVIMQKGWQGDIYKCITFVVDITERKKAEEELRKVNEELEEYAHTVSHALKGPLSTIGLTAELLRSMVDDDCSGDMADVIDSLERNAGLSQRRINSLLELAESGQKPAEIENLDVRGVIDEILQEMAPRLKAGGVKVIADENLGGIRANRAQISQVFLNLITNAVKHNDSAEPSVTISYLGKGTDGLSRYIVHDNGPGIPSDEFEKIFIPFFKGKKSSETGLGLSIARKIAGIYGGGIRAYNDNGASFEVTLKDLT